MWVAIVTIVTVALFVVGVYLWCRDRNRTVRRHHPSVLLSRHDDGVHRHAVGHDYVRAGGEETRPC